MIKSVTATNYLGESLTMGIGDPDESGLLISSIDGIGPGESDINVTEFAATDGGIYNSSRIPTRNIVINMLFKYIPTIEDARHLTYKMFPLKKPINLIFETDNRLLQIDGYVESNEPDIFSKQEGTSISIICPGYYFYSLAEASVKIDGVKKLFEFPFYNDVEGLIDYTETIDILEDNNYDPILDSNGDNINTLVITSDFETEKITTIDDMNYQAILDSDDIPIDGYTPITRYKKEELIPIDDSNYQPILDSDGFEINGVRILTSSDKNIIFGEILNKCELYINNEGDAETGMVVNIHFLGPASGITIYNAISKETMNINTAKIASIVGSGIKAFDDLIISTVTGNKKITLIREGKSYNVLNCLTRHSDWVKLEAGRNLLNFTAESGMRNLQFNIEYYPLFEGV